jgi:hypothetical protein
LIHACALQLAGPLALRICNVAAQRVATDRNVRRPLASLASLHTRAGARRWPVARSPLARVARSAHGSAPCSVERRGGADGGWRAFSDG